MSEGGHPPTASSSHHHYTKARAATMKQDSLENPSSKATASATTSSVKRKGTVSSRVSKTRRESSGQYSRQRRPSAAADFWANFNYVDVVGRSDDKSGEDHHHAHHHHRHHKSSHKHPHRSHHHHHDRSDSRSRQQTGIKETSSTIEKDSSTGGETGRKQSILTAFSISSPGGETFEDSLKQEASPMSVTPVTVIPGQHHHLQSLHPASQSNRLMMKQMSLDSRHHVVHHLRRRSSSATAAGVTSLDSFEDEDEEEGLTREKREGGESFVMKVVKTERQREEERLRKDMHFMQHKMDIEEDDIDVVQVIEVDDERRKRRRRKKKQEEEEAAAQQLEQEVNIGIEDIAGEGEGGEEEEVFDPNRPYPEFADLSFNCLNQTSQLRQVCIRMIMNPYPAARQRGSTILQSLFHSYIECLNKHAKYPFFMP